MPANDFGEVGVARGSGPPIRYHSDRDAMPPGLNIATFRRD